MHTVMTASSMLTMSFAWPSMCTMSRPATLGETQPFQMRVNRKQMARWRKQATEERRDLSSWIRCVLDDYIAAKKKDHKGA